MLSKGEAIQRLKKMGVVVADDQSMVTILLPSDISFPAGIKDIKEKLKSMEYEASFCVRQSKTEQEVNHTINEMTNKQIMREGNSLGEEEPFDEEDDLEMLSEEELKGSLLSMDEDGQFTLGEFGLDL